MKLAHVFTLVVGLHLAVIAALFVTPGCASDTNPGVQPAAPVGQPGLAQEEAPLPVVDSGTRPQPVDSVKRYPPTRPSWNLNESSQAEVIVPPQPQSRPQPMPQNETVYVAEELEVIQPTSSGMDGFNTAPSTSYSSSPSTSYSAPAFAASVPGTTYIVKKGDTLGGIAKRNGVSLNGLMAANGYTRETANRLKIGEKLTIPAVDGEAEAPAAVPSPSYAGASIDQEGVAYTVQPGDSLSRIATRQGSTVAAIKSANGLSSDVIRVGQELLIPQVEPEPAPVVGVPNAQGQVTYVVKPGDTLGAIAKRYDVSVKEVMDANGIFDPRRLRVDQQLIIPTDLQPVAPAPKPVTQPKPAPRPSTQAVPAPLQPAMPAPQPVMVEEVDVESIDLEAIDLDSIEPVNVQETP
ncbi:MAG: LysM peptidoglycan-binding domain-containing protein [Puniceicoccales bacterium]